MRYLVIPVIVLFAVIAAGQSSGVQAHGPSPGHLGDHGWNCFNVPGLGVHCGPPGNAASSATLTFLYFDTSDPADEDAPFLGTETLIRADLYRGQPCPQQGLDDYFGLDLFGGPEIDYYACHNN